MTITKKIRYDRIQFTSDFSFSPGTIRVFLCLLQAIPFQFFISSQLTKKETFVFGFYMLQSCLGNHCF